MADKDALIPQIVLRPIETLVPYARNSRTHSPQQIAQIKASLLEFGWTNPVLADAIGIVAGHGRTLAAESLYAEGKQIKFPNGAPIPVGMAPVVDCTGWSASQRRAYIIADNQLALNAGWDEEMLRLELEELKSDDFALDLLGFGDDVLNGFLGEETGGGGGGTGDPDDAPPVPETPVSVAGDIWVCGSHRVMCGSSLNLEDWLRLMDGEQADCCWTDPPYNVAYESKLAGKIKNDDMTDKQFREFLEGAFSSLAAIMRPGAPIYVAHADGGPGEAFRASFRAAGFKLSGCLIWRKSSFTLSRSDYQWIHEAILYGWKTGAGHSWYGGRKQTTIADIGEGNPFVKQEDGRWAIRLGDQILIVSGDATLEEAPGSVIYHEKPARSDLHPTMKPVALIEKMLLSSARSGDVVVDAFGGSGSTMLASERLGMRSRLMELDPKFVDVICRRYWAFTGHRPVHAVTGEPFPADGEVRAVSASVLEEALTDAKGEVF